MRNRAVSALISFAMLGLPDAGEAQSQRATSSIPVAVVVVEEVTHPDPARSAVALAVLAPAQPQAFVLIPPHASAEDLARALIQVMALRERRPARSRGVGMAPVETRRGGPAIPEWHLSQARAVLDRIREGTELEFRSRGADFPPGVDGVMSATLFFARISHWLPEPPSLPGRGGRP